MDIPSSREGRQTSENIRALVAKMPDDYQLIPSLNPIFPLRQVMVDDRDFTHKVSKELSYLEQTGDLEIASERVAVMQHYVDQILGKESSDKARVVIMKRGKTPRAFSLPDGTIVLNQALLNVASDADEISRILTYEARLVQEKDFEAGELLKPHPQFPVSLIRGELHRAVEIPDEYKEKVKTPFALLPTDDVAGEALKDIPQSWKTVSVEPTNREIAEEAIAQNPELDVDTLKTLFSKLSPTDFIPSNYHPYPHMKEAFYLAARERLQGMEYPEPVIKHALLLMFGTIHGVGVIQSPEEVVALMNYVTEPTASLLITEAYTAIYGEKPFVEASPGYFLEVIEGQGYFVEAEGQKKEGIPLTEDALLESIKIVYDTPGYTGFYPNEKSAPASSLLPNYISKMYFKDGTIDTKELHKFFQRVKDKGIVMDPDFVEDCWDEAKSLFVSEQDKQRLDADPNGYWNAFIDNIDFRLSQIMKIMRNVFV